MFVIGMENQLAFGMVVIIGSMIALGLGFWKCQKAGISVRKTMLATVFLPLFTLFFAHLLYCMVDLEYTLYCYSFGYLFAFWEGGYMLYGGMLGVLLCLLLVGGKKDFSSLLLQYAPSGAWMIVVSRIAEGTMGQGYGEYFWEDSFFAQFPFSVYDPYCEAWAWALFLMEALVAFGLFVVLIRTKPSWRLDHACLLVGLYASVQIVFESLRRDEFLRWGFVRVSEVISVVLVLLCLLCYCLQAGKGKLLAKTLCWVSFVALTVFCLLLEFATEGRIPFLRFLDVTGCYAMMAVSCVLMGGCVLWMRSLCPWTNEKESCVS